VLHKQSLRHASLTQKTI